MPRTRLIEMVSLLSIGSGMDAFDEWRLDSRYEMQDGMSTCACGQHIKYIYVIRNEQTNHTLYVGSGCIYHF